ncbi:MAG: carbohydrate ABC transporter permease [Clostridia bacterium]|nr:carbohydrate ABC transporter permease [Clostridia bacterium]
MKFKMGDKIVGYINAMLLSLFAAICILPFINVLAVSLSSNRAIVSGMVTVYPIELNYKAYIKVLTDRIILKSIGFSAVLTILYVACALILTIMLAYGLSRKKLRGRNFILLFVTFTMYFNGGIIPTFLVVQKLGLLDSIWSLVLPVAINTYYMIIMKTFFSSIPESLIESAVLDGCNEFMILIKIVLPLSLPVIATMALFYAVYRWNAFQDAVFYISDPDKFPIQLRLRELILQNQINQDIQTDSETFVSEGIRAASLMVATAPILVVYPWLQKYFVKGMTIGAVKG